MLPGTISYIASFYPNNSENFSCFILKSQGKLCSPDGKSLQFFSYLTQFLFFYNCILFEKYEGALK